LFLLASIATCALTPVAAQVGPLGGAGVSLPLSPANGGTGTNNGSLISTGTPPVLTGTCATGTQVGGNTAGRFSTTAGCAATTVIMTFLATAPNGWACKTSDQTTPADSLNQNASTTTSATLIGTTAAADVISFQCQGY
jgi:hypothetical protein